MNLVASTPSTWPSESLDGVVPRRSEMHALDAHKHKHEVIDNELARHAPPVKPPWRSVKQGADALACRVSECSLGNLVADAMARSAACHSQRRVPLIALIESGSVRGAVKVGKFGRDEATNVLPWANRLEVVRFPSVDALEAIVAFGAQSLKTTGGGFLQASGNVRIVLNDDRARVFVRHFDCSQTQRRVRR